MPITLVHKTQLQLQIRYLSTGHATPRYKAGSSRRCLTTQAIDNTTILLVLQTIDVGIEGLPPEVLIV